MKPANSAHEDLAMRKFTIDDNIMFSQISGDRNPVHINEVVARRTIFGTPVAHGIHLTLWGLDRAFSKTNKSLLIDHIKVKFKHPVRINQSVDCFLVNKTDDHLKLSFNSFGREAAVIECSFKINNEKMEEDSLYPIQESNCTNRELDELSGLKGNMDLQFYENETKKLFPVLTRLLPYYQIAVFLAMTRLIGMECPGRQSIFLGIDAKFNSDEVKNLVLSYSVRSVHKLLGLVKIDISGGNFNGHLSAGYRPKEVYQESCSILGHFVRDNEFSNQKALIIGGSRGLGEISSKLIAAGGGSVQLSYALGETEALAIRDEILEEGKDASCFKCDVTDNSFNLSEHLPDAWSPTHLYYFATPYISLNETTAFIYDLFLKYCLFYIGGFSKIFLQALSMSDGKLNVLYPSTVAINEILPKASEYASAKASGESLCKHYEKIYTKTTFHIPRLPRLLTDQTSTLMPVENANIIESILSHIRCMNC